MHQLLQLERIHICWHKLFRPMLLRKHIGSQCLRARDRLLYGMCCRCHRSMRRFITNLAVLERPTSATGNNNESRTGELDVGRMLCVSCPDHHCTKSGRLLDVCIGSQNTLSCDIVVCALTRCFCAPVVKSSQRSS
jgi:hypothetical protein